jgi:hypothetical protein
VHVVVNNPMSKASMGLADVERILARSVAVEFLNDGLKPEKAALAGKVLALQEPNGLTARSAAALALRLERHLEKPHRSEEDPRAFVLKPHRSPGLVIEA